MVEKYVTKFLHPGLEVRLIPRFFSGFSNQASRFQLSSKLILTRPRNEHYYRFSSIQFMSNFIFAMYLSLQLIYICLSNSNRALTLVNFFASLY